METDATDPAVKPNPPVITFGGIQTLREQLGKHFGKNLGVPNLQENDLNLLDDAVALLSPSEAQVRVVEVDTFMESERSIVKGDAMIGGRDSFSCRQMVVILKRVAGMPDKGEEAGMAAAPEAHPSVLESGSRSEEDCKTKEGGSATAEPEHAPTASVGAWASTDVNAQDVDADWQELPEIILFWGRNRRSGGNLVVCPEKSMDRLIQAYLVCEVVEDTAAKKSINTTSLSTRESFRDRIIPEREGALMGVELGEATASEQDALGNLLSDYSFHDASIGIVSLAASIYYFGPQGRNDVNVLTLLAVAVVAGLNQEATWPWVFKQILHCSSIKDPLVRVSQCRRVHHHQGQLSGQGFLAIGLAVFGVYLEVFPAEDGHTPTLFRILLNVFQGGMIAVLVVNMVQAVEPMAMANLKPMDRLRQTSRELLRENVFDTAWYLTLMVALVWGGIIAAVVTQLSYEPEHLGWSISIVCIVVLSLSACTVNPGMALLGVWALVWLIPTGLALVLRSAFDTTMLVINRVSLVSRRMAREVSAHAGSSMQERISVRGFLFLLLQVLPLTPLLAVYLPLPLLYVLSWFLHVSLRLLLLLADAIIYPLSPLKLYPLLSDYGSVTWKMGRLDMDVEQSSMRTLLKGRVSKLMETSGLGARVENGVLPAKPYAHLSAVSVPRLGCAAIVPSQDEETERVLFVSATDRARKGGGGKSATDGS